MFGRRATRFAALAAAIFVIASPSAQAESKCKLMKVADMPVTMNSLRPIIDVKFNDQPAKLTLDSGAFYSTITNDAAAEFGLVVHPAPFGYYIKGIGGDVQVGIAKVKRFTIVGVAVPNVEFLVGGSSVRTPGYVSSAGLMGQNLLEMFDVEYDLATGMVRLFKSEGCDKAMMAYWLKPGQTYSVMATEGVDARNPHTIGTGILNGQKIRIAFDTGAFTSLLSLKAAQRAGIKPDSPGVTDAGYSTGIGSGASKSYFGTFATFGIGDGEEIKNAKLRFADLNLGFADMLLGADFFISHHIFVATKERKLYLTYNGGPVFNLSKTQAPLSADAQPPPTPAPSEEPASAASQASAEASQSAAELARLGSALMARRDFEHGIADLDKAVAQSPDDPEYRYQRANAYQLTGQSDKALADYDRAIALREDFLPAYIPRAQIKLHNKDRQGATADLDAVARLAPKSADLRFQLAEGYEAVERLPATVEQITLWIDYHDADSRMERARLLRCWANMLQNQDLPQALSDCNWAVHHVVRDDAQRSYAYDVRGMVFLRQGSFDKAIADFNDALKAQPRLARALYGRGIAEAHENKKAASDADLNEAKTIDAKIGESFEHFGFVL
jgi:tetratricopeptide (TPR) repeat protein/predicted aspartyl protease